MHNDYKKWRNTKLASVAPSIELEPTITNVPLGTKNNLTPMAKTKVGNWFANKDWKGLVSFLWKWLLQPSCVIGGYEATNYLISNYL